MRVYGVQTSDNHLSPTIWSSYASLCSDALWALEQIADYCVSRKVDWWILAGDIIDKPINGSPPIADLSCVLDKVSKKHPDLVAYYIQGQHEMSDPPWMSCVRGNTQHIHDRTVDLSGIGPTYGLDYRKGSNELTEAFKRIPKDTRLLVAHQVWEEFMGGVANCDGSLAAIPHASHVLTGDLHKHLVKRIKRPGQPDLIAMSPGATHVRKLDEPKEHYFFAWTDDPVKPLKSVKLHGRQFFSFEILTDNLSEFRQQFEGFMEYAAEYAKKHNLPARVAKPVLHLHYNSDIPGLFNRVQDIVNDRAFIFDRAIRFVKDKLRVDGQELKALTDLGLLGCLRSAVGDTSSRLYADAERLLKSDNIIDEIRKLKAEHFSETKIPETKECLPTQVS